MKIFRFTILFCVICSNLFANQVNLNSWWSVWNDPSQPDTTRLNAIQRFAESGYLYSQPDSAFYFAQLQYDYADKKGLKKQKASALSLLGESSYYKGNLDIAVDYHKRSLVIQEEIGNMKGIANCYHSMGCTYQVAGNYASALDDYARSLTINEKIGNKTGIATTLANTGMIYREQGDLANALDYYTRSLAIYEEIRQKRGTAISLASIGNIFCDQEDYSTALDYYNRSLTISEEIEDKHRTAFSLLNIGLVYNKQGDSARALDYYKLSLTLFEEIGTQQGIAQTLKRMGDVHYEQGDYASAISYNIRSLSIAQEIGVAEETMEAAQALYKAYKATNRNRQSLEMYELYVSTRDSINSEQNQQEVLRQKYKYEYEKQAIADSLAYASEKLIQVSKLQKSRIQLYAVIFGMILLIGFLGLLYNRFRLIRAQKQVIEDQNSDLMKMTRAIEHSSASIVITDINGEIEYVNPKFTEVTGYNAEEALGNNPRILKSGLQPKEFYSELWETIVSGQDWRGEICNLNKSGEEYWELASISPIRDDHGDITHFVAVKEDVTEARRIAEELKEAKETAEDATKAKSDFLANMSHEIRTPMNAILGMAHLAQKTELTPKQLDYLKKIDISAQSLLGIINDILDFSKIEAGKLDIEEIEFDLMEKLDSVAAMVTVKAQKRNHYRYYSELTPKFQTSSSATHCDWDR